MAEANIINIPIEGNGAIYMTPKQLDNEIAQVKNRDEIVLQKEMVNIIIDYPLNNQYSFEVTPFNDKTYFTREDLIRKIAELYQKIYDEENESSILPEESVHERAKKEGKWNGMMNRALTNGKYGIWGHILGDLVIQRITYIPSKNQIALGIGS